MKTKSFDTVLAVALVLVVVSALAHTWQQTDPAQLGFGAVGMSADGRIICAVPSASHPIISSDFGNTWVVATNIPPRGGALLGGVTVSADGSKIFASLATNGPQGFVYVSSDHGTNWTQTAFPGPSSFHHLACSADGMKVIAAVANSGIFYSTNGGTNCYASSAPSPGWFSVASSADGKLMAAAYSLGLIYFSRDFGATWTAANLLSSGPFWNSVCVSGNGKSVGAISSDSYISSDSGASWKTNHIGGQTIACSADGTSWLITGAQVYTSTNTGGTWQTNLASASWFGGAVSADGCEMIVNGFGQNTYIGRLTPSPQLKIQPSGTNMSVSWLIPSTNFVLQQTADLSDTGWTPVSIPQTLNFTNLEKQVTVPANGSNAFFRLTAQ